MGKIKKLETIVGISGVVLIATKMYILAIAIVSIAVFLHVKKYSLHKTILVIFIAAFLSWLLPLAFDCSNGPMSVKTNYTCLASDEGDARGLFSYIFMVCVSIGSLACLYKLLGKNKANSQFT